MKIQTLGSSSLLAGLLGVAVLCPPRAVADYASAVKALNPVAYYRFTDTNQVPTEVPAVNRGSLGAAFNGEYQVMADARGRAGAIAGDADTSVFIDGSTGAQVVVPYSPDYNPAGPFSVEFWANPANNDAGTHTAASAMVNGQNPRTPTTAAAGACVTTAPTGSSSWGMTIPTGPPTTARP